MKESVAILVFIALFSGCLTAHSTVGEPLFLTLLIKNNQTDVARQKARVEHNEMKDLESYAGFLTINQTHNSNIFFWFIKSKSDPTNDPLILWLTGGPGSTFLVNLFWENGPFSLNEDMSLHPRKYSWHRNHNILYVDSPIGTGFSFTDNEEGYATTSEAISQDLLIVLRQFFQLFPEMRQNDFYVTGQSVAGKFASVVSHAIMRHNKMEGEKINLKGLAIASGFVDPPNQIDFADFFYANGLIDSRRRETLKRTENKIKMLIALGMYEKAMEVFDTLFLGHYNESSLLFNNLTGYSYVNNILMDQRPEELSYHEEWVKQEDSRRALHVGNLTFRALDHNVAVALKGDLMKTVARYLNDLLPHYKVMVYTGTLDVCVPYTTSQNFVEHLPWAKGVSFKKAERKQWRIGKDLAGYVKKVKNLSLVAVRNSGHLVGMEQPLWAWDMITRFTRNLPF